MRSFSAFQLTASNRQISIPNCFEVVLTETGEGSRDPISGPLRSHQMKARDYFRSLKAVKSGCPAGKFTFSTASAISGNFLATSSLP